MIKENENLLVLTRENGVLTLSRYYLNGSNSELLGEGKEYFVKNDWLTNREYNYMFRRMVDGERLYFTEDQPLIRQY